MKKYQSVILLAVANWTISAADSIAATMKAYRFQGVVKADDSTIPSSLRGQYLVKTELLFNARPTPASEVFVNKVSAHPGYRCQVGMNFEVGSWRITVARQGGTGQKSYETPIRFQELFETGLNATGECPDPKVNPPNPGYVIKRSYYVGQKEAIPAAFSNHYPAGEPTPNLGPHTPTMLPVASPDPASGKVLGMTLFRGVIYFDYEVALTDGHYTASNLGIGSYLSTLEGSHGQTTVPSVSRWGIIWSLFAKAPSSFGEWRSVLPEDRVAPLVRY